MSVDFIAVDTASKRAPINVHHLITKYELQKCCSLAEACASVSEQHSCNSTNVFFSGLRVDQTMTVNNI